LIGNQRTGAETADGECWAVECQRRDNGIDARTVGQTCVDHWRGLIDSPADARDNAVDDLHQVAIITEYGINSRQNSLFFDKHVVFAVDQDVRNLQIPEQGFERAEAEDFVEEV